MGQWLTWGARLLFASSGKRCGRGGGVILGKAQSIFCERRARMGRGEDFTSKPVAPGRYLNKRRGRVGEVEYISTGERKKE